MGRLRVLLRSAVTFVQLIVVAILFQIYLPILAIVGFLNLIYHLITGENFDNFDLALEPLMWSIHQLKVLFAIESDFRAAPYIS